MVGKVLVREGLVEKPGGGVVTSVQVLIRTIPPDFQPHRPAASVPGLYIKQGGQQSVQMHGIGAFAAK